MEVEKKEKKKKDVDSDFVVEAYCIGGQNWFPRYEVYMIDELYGSIDRSGDGKPNGSDYESRRARRRHCIKCFKWGMKIRTRNWTREGRRITKRRRKADARANRVVNNGLVFRGK